MHPMIKTGTLLGDDAAQNVSLGFVPDYVEVTNITDGNKITKWYRGATLGFDSGGTTAIQAGDWIKSTTSGAFGLVLEVILASGAFADGDAAGILVLADETIEGTFANNDVLEVMAKGGHEGAAAVGDATGAVVYNGVDIDTEVASATGNAAISAYAGVAGSASEGFTIGSTISDAGDRLKWVAARGLD